MIRYENGEIIHCTAAEIAEIEARVTAEAVAAAERVTTDRLSAIDVRLAAIDVDAIRPLRAIAASTATQFDSDKLAALEAEAAALRAERAGLV